MIEQAKSPWLTIEGVLLIFLGVAALAAPLVAGLAAALVFAWILILAGLVGVISAFAGRAHAHQGWSVVSATIALAAGAVLLLRPLIGAVGLALIVAAYLLFDGIVLIGLALDHRKRGERAWGWLLASGILDIALAALVADMRAVASAVLVGVIVGIDLIAAGIALVIAHRWRRAPLVI